MATARPERVSTPAADEPVVLFDGVCNLCHGTVRFVIARDPTARFRFASLQSEPGRRLAQAHGVTPGSLDSMLLIEQGRAYCKSTCALRVARKLRFPWPLAYLLILVPTPVRDAVYDFVGRRRYRWFGRRDLCLVSDPGVKERFLT